MIKNRNVEHAEKVASNHDFKKYLDTLFLEMAKNIVNKEIIMSNLL